MQINTNGSLFLWVNEDFLTLINKCPNNLPILICLLFIINEVIIFLLEKHTVSKWPPSVVRGETDAGKWTTKVEEYRG